MSDQNGFREHATRFNRIFVKAIIASLIIGILLGVGFNITKAEDTDSDFKSVLDTSDPLTVAKYARACRMTPFGTLTEADMFNTVVVSTGVSETTPEAYLRWTILLGETASWSVLYGYSLMGLDEYPIEETNDGLFGTRVIDPVLAKDCRESLKALPTILSGWQRKAYSDTWRGVKQTNVTEASTPSDEEIKEAAWCGEIFDFAIRRLNHDPMASFQIDREADGGPERLKRFQRLFAKQKEWWRLRGQKLDAAGYTAAFSRQDGRIRQVAFALNNSNLKPQDIAAIKSEFLKQETNICAAKHLILKDRL